MKWTYGKDRFVREGFRLPQVERTAIRRHYKVSVKSTSPFHSVENPAVVQAREVIRLAVIEYTKAMTAKRQYRTNT